MADPQNPKDPNEKPIGKPDPNVVPPIPGSGLSEEGLKHTFKTTAESIIENNNAIRFASGDLATALAAHKDEIEQVTNALSKLAQYIGQITDRPRRNVGGVNVHPGGIEGEGELSTSPSEMASAQREEEIVRQRKSAREAFKKYQKAPPEEQFQQLAHYGVLQDSGVDLGTTKLSPEDVKKVLGDKSNNVGILDELNKVLAAQIEKEVVKEGPGFINSLTKTLEESGIKQLKYGTLPLQDILRAGGAAAGKYYEQKTTDENGNPLPTSVEIGAGTAMLGKFSTLLPELGRFLGVGGVVADAAKNLYERSFQGLYRQPTLSGQLTGESTTAGIRASFQGKALGANPFDLLSGGQGQEIVAATREMGMTGNQGWNVETALASVVGRLGISIQQAAEFFSESMRQGGESVSTVTQTLNGFNTSAYNLSENINTYTSQVLSNMESLRSAGAGSKTPGIASALQIAAPPGYRQSGAGQQALQQILGSTQGQAQVAAIVSQMPGGQGVTPYNLLSHKYVGLAYGQGMDALLRRAIGVGQQANPGADPRTVDGANSIAAFLAQTYPGLQGMDVGLLGSMIQQEAKSGFSHYTSAVSAGLASATFASQQAKIHPNHNAWWQSAINAVGGAAAATGGAVAMPFQRGYYVMTHGGNLPSDHTNSPADIASMEQALQAPGYSNWIATRGRRGATWAAQLSKDIQLGSVDQNALRQILAALPTRGLSAIPGLSADQIKKIPETPPTNVSVVTRLEINPKSLEKFITERGQVTKVNEKAINTGRTAPNQATSVIPRYVPNK